MWLLVAMLLMTVSAGALTAQEIPMGAFTVRIAPSAPTVQRDSSEPIPGAWSKEYLRTLASTRPRLVTMSVLAMAGDILASHGSEHRDIQVYMRGCRSPGYFYSYVAREIELCDEMVPFTDSVARWGLSLTRDPGPPVATDPSTVADRFMTFAVLHEAGHALAHRLQISVLDGKEDTADSFAALMLLRSDLEPVVSDAGLWFTYYQGWVATGSSGTAPDSAHARRAGQRAAQLRCFIRGHQGRRESDEDRRCADVWGLVVKAWEPAMSVHPE